MRIYSGSRLPDLHPPALNCIVSNVPGPPVPLYTAGARIRAIYPMGPLQIDDCTFKNIGTATNRVSHVTVNWTNTTINGQPGH